MSMRISFGQALPAVERRARHAERHRRPTIFALTCGANGNFVLTLRQETRRKIERSSACRQRDYRSPIFGVQVICGFVRAAISEYFQRPAQRRWQRINGRDRHDRGQFNNIGDGGYGGMNFYQRAAGTLGETRFADSTAATGGGSERAERINRRCGNDFRMATSKADRPIRCSVNVTATNSRITQSSDRRWKSAIDQAGTASVSVTSGGRSTPL